LTLDDHKVLLYRIQPSGWVAEVPSIPGCDALMPTRAEALAELEQVFAIIEAELRDAGATLPADTTEAAHAWRAGGRVSPGGRAPWIRTSTANRQP